MLNTFKADLSAHVSTVQSICSQAEATGDVSVRASLAIKLKAELEAVLAIIINARVGLQHCKNTPQPSQAPTTGVPSVVSDPSSETKGRAADADGEQSVIVEIIIAIFVQLQAILTVVIRACASISVFQSTCASPSSF